MIILDTTVLVYAVGDRHDFQEPCRQLIVAIEAGEVRAATTTEVIQEFVHVRSRRRGRRDAVALGIAFADLLSPLLVADEPALRAGWGIFEHAGRLGTFDSVLAAVALANSAVALVSADGAFAEVADILHVVPDTAGIASLIKGSNDRGVGT